MRAFQAVGANLVTFGGLGKHGVPFRRCSDTANPRHIAIGELQSHEQLPISESLDLVQGSSEVDGPRRIVAYPPLSLVVRGTRGPVGAKAARIWCGMRELACRGTGILGIDCGVHF